MSPTTSHSQKPLLAPPPEQYWAEHKNDPAHAHHAAAAGSMGEDDPWWNKAVVALMPLVPPVMVWPLAKRYVAGATLADMDAAVARLNAAGCRCMVNILGEYATTQAEARATAEAYKATMAHLAQADHHANITVKLTSLGLLVDQALCRQLATELVEAAATHKRFVRFEMEDSSLTSDIIDLYLAVRASRPANCQQVGIVIQAYLRRSLDDVRRICQAGAGHFRLCKGIYREPRWLAYHQPELVNKNYVRLLEEMLQAGAYVGIATHDEQLVWEAVNLIDRLGLTTEHYEFQMLMGVDEPLRQMLVAAHHPVRVYVPYGQQWHAYSLRRFKENPKIARYVLNNLLGGH